MIKDNELEFLQFHYYLNNEEHSMDARIHNKVESHLIKIIEEISFNLGIEFSIEVQALEEGGVISNYKLKKALIGGSLYLSGILTTVLGSTIAHKINSDSEMDNLLKKQAIAHTEHEIAETERAKAETEKIRLEIQKLKNEKNKELEISQDSIKLISLHIASQNKVIITKSNLFRHLSQESKVDKISTQSLNKDFQPIKEEKIIKRSDFIKHIVNDVKVDAKYESQIELEIVSPVLLNNRMNWKAIYNDELITFSLKDKQFRNLIVSKNLQFSTGTKLLCDLEIKRKINHKGEIVNMGKSVYSVTQIIYTDGDVIDL
ncbi:hypothetical protein [Wenyingzhuangia aestuarii]|uniref:hypothetical protein n=1 Tax=Wenyingzhuangia aestuarii TaxID=1647582 RepID=UPI00143A3821|nr:hypothetical protein [Wenyingzhuangia aestuarii]NJB84191.1 hypothetical protein [Wenyingzhuangia aestuarii]